jgi:hypothetical protein
MKLYKPEYFSRRRWALSSHEDLVEIIRWVREHPGTKLSQLSQDYYRLEDDEGDAPEKADQKRAFNLVATILAMVNCATSPYSSELLETGYVPTSWRDRVSISDFFKESFLQNFDGLVDNENETLKITGVLPKLSAPLLRKRAGLQFKPTCDLRDHLRLNSKEGIVHVFHLTAVLKEHLMAGEGTDAGGWTIPRPLALETLDTIHEVLFPPDEAAQEMLRSLVSHNGFDSDCQHFERARFQGRDDDEERSYQYWGRRLALLYAELEHPTPRGWLQTWLERRSGARYVLLATLIGAIVAVILGILSLGVAGLQAWIAWQQWKHTVSRR